MNIAWYTRVARDEKTLYLARTCVREACFVAPSFHLF